MSLVSCRLIQVSLCAAGLVLAAVSGVTAQPGPAIVEVDEARIHRMAPEVAVSGTVVSMNDSAISAEVTGRIKWVAPEGTFVEAGAVIAEIDDRDIRFGLQRVEAQKARLSARVDFLQGDLSRLETLAADNYSPVSRLEEARSTLLMARQDIADMEVQIRQARTNLERTQVRAPFPGRVVARLAQTGEYAVPGREIVRLVDTQHVEVSAQAPLSLARVLDDGVGVSLMAADRTEQAAVRAIVPVGDPTRRTMELRVTPPADMRLAVGEAVEIGVPSAPPADVLAVPRDALILRSDGAFVFRILGDGTAERLAVKTGAASGQMVAVSGGLSGGDRVVVRGGERLRPGQPVEIRQLESAVSR